MQVRSEKQKVKENADILAVTFDLQQVLTAPKLAIGSAYYKRKLNIYNLTIYDMQTKDGYCYTCCLVEYLEQLDKTGW